MRIFNYDTAGIFIRESEADPSPLEPGAFLIPARATTIAPPADLTGDQVPRWNGAAWQAVRRPVRPNETDNPIDKLREFLDANPDVAALLQVNTEVAQE